MRQKIYGKLIVHGQDKHGAYVIIELTKGAPLPVTPSGAIRTVPVDELERERAHQGPRRAPEQNPHDPTEAT